VTTARRIRARTAAGVAAGVAIGVAVGWLAWRGRSNAANAGVVRTYMQQPAAEALPAGTSDFTFAPNGDLIYVGPGDRPGTTQLWRKELAGLHATRIDGTIGAGQPFVSPDGKWIAFWSVAGLQRVSAAGGGAAMIIPDLTFSEGRGTWLADGRVMVLARTWIGLVNQDGGKVDVVVDASRFAGFSPMRVAPLPGGRSFFVQTCPPGCSQSVVYHVDLATNAIRVALPQARNPVLLRTGQLAYVTQSGQLTIAPVDVRTGTIGAPARAVADNVSAFDVSPQGDLVYREGQDGVAVRPVNVDRAGRVAIIDSSWVGFFSTGALSPDGKRFVASVISRSEQQLWIKELPRGSFSRFTFDAGDHFRPAWSSDGAFIRYIQHVDTNFVLMEKRADGVGNPRVIPIGPHHAVDVTSSRDGSIAVRTGATDTSKTILILRDATDANPRAAAPEPGLRLSPTVSPDGRFIAYASVAAGNAEIYVSPFPDIESARWQVSRNGGVEPRWSHDGKELFYVSSRDELMAAGVALAPSFSVTSMTTLFRAGSYQHDGGFHTYEPFPDNQHFLMLQRETLPGSLVLTTNWLQAVAARR
jgi:Tol biopolymer transport system component